MCENCGSITLFLGIDVTGYPIYYCNRMLTTNRTGLFEEGILEPCDCGYRSEKGVLKRIDSATIGSEKRVEVISFKKERR